MADEILRARGLRKDFGSNCALHGLDLSVKAGEFVALLGENGAGKSTLLRILMNFEKESSGELTLFGQDRASDPYELRARIGFVSEDIQFETRIPLRNFISSYGKLYPQFDQSFVEAMLKHQAIPSDRRFEKLSRGQKMQALLTLALGIRPKLILIDEATAVLDAAARSFYLAQLRLFVKNGGSVVLATNVLSDVEGSANRVLILHQGKVVWNNTEGDTARLFVKIRHVPGESHEIFKNPRCIFVHPNTDGSASYVISRDLAVDLAVPASFLDRRSIRIEELYLYLAACRKVSENAAAA